MESQDIRMIADSVIANRINVLKRILNTSKNGESLVLAMMHLASIGTEQAIDEAIAIIKGTKNEDVQALISGAFVLYCPIKGRQKKMLIDIFGADSELDETFSKLKKIDSELRTLPPLWQEITTAIEQSLGGPGD